MAKENQGVFRSLEVVESFIGREGWLDPGERVALLRVAPAVRSAPVLDIGVGLGRTGSLLRLLTDSYIGIDYSPEMVQWCRQLHPEMDVRLGDARDLSAYEDGTFALVYFSNNGVDAVDADGRRSFLAEARRVLRDDGILVLNTLNKEGQNYGETPWEFHRPGQPPNLSPKNVARWGWQNLNDPMRLPRRYRNWFVKRREATDSGGAAMFPMSGHDFSLVVHFVTITRLRAELDEAGFDVTDVYDSTTGDLLPLETEHTDAGAFYALATKRA